jgi:hypothetical protein
MAENKKYVCIQNVGVKDAFDNKYKSTLPKIMTARIEKAINSSSKLTTKPPADKKAEGFYLDGSLSLRRTDKGIEAELKMALADWPKKSIFGVATSKASVEVGDPAKIDKDVDAVIDALLDDVQAKVIKELEKRAK